MGGLGSGRQDGKKCLDGHRRLDIRQLQRRGELADQSSVALTWTQHQEVVRTVQVDAQDSAVVLSHLVRTRSGEWRRVSYPVEISWSHCTFGGKRAWWVCPRPRCGRRVAMLYDVQTFACRHCHHLQYRSQRQSAADRSIRRADKLRVRLGWAPGILVEEGSKPPGMHWSKYVRLRRAYHRQLLVALGGLGTSLGAAERSLGRTLNMLTSRTNRV